jgi:DNA-binding transcriptional MerR regulator
MERLNDPSLFDDGKAPDALRTIGEVAKALGVRQHVLRYWEEQFPMLRPVRRSGRRYYRPEDVVLIARLDRMVHHEGFTLRGARLAIEGEKAGTGIEPEATPGFSIEALIGIRDRLARVLAAA